MNVRAQNLVQCGERWQRPSVVPVGLSTPADSLLGNVVTLAFLSPPISQARLAEQLAGALRRETDEPVLLVRLNPPTARVSLADWKHLESTLNGEFCFHEQLVSEPGGFVSLDFDFETPTPDDVVLGSILGHFREHFRHVLLALGSDLTNSASARCISRSDAACLFLSQSEGSLYHLNCLVRSVMEQSDGDAVQIHPVLCLAAEETAHGFHNRFSGGSDTRAEVEFEGLPVEELFLLRDRKDTFGPQVRSLARSLCGRRVGLALSSGGAKGLAHIGVIQMLEENGIEIDAVAGCSMGAYIASIWTYGLDGTALEGLAREIESRWGLWKLIDPALPPRRGFVNGRAVIHRLKRSIGDAHFSDLVRPLRIVATNLATLDRVVFASGEVATAVHASSAIPGICVPVTMAGETYIDGGVTDPLPIGVLREMGIERIIAVNTIPTPSYLQCCRELEREQAELGGCRPGRFPCLGAHLNYFARGNILDIMMRAVHGAQIRVAEQACRRADVVLRPLACDARWHDFTHPRKYIALGRQVTREHLDEIKSLRKGEVHESEPAQNRMAVTG